MRIAHVALAIPLVVACGHPASTPPAPVVPPIDAAPAPAPDGGAPVSSDSFPNLRAQLRLRFRSPSVPERTIEQTIWLRGARFHIREAAGRPVNQILADVTDPGGLGDAPRTMEEIMDRRSAARRPPTGVVDIYGDLASDVAWIDAPHTPRWTRPAHEVAPIARQVLAADRASGLAAGATRTVLGHAATEYRGDVTVGEAGVSRDNRVVRLLAPPYLLLDETRDATNPDHFYLREVVALDLDAATDADVTPP